MGRLLLILLFTVGCFRLDAAESLAHFGNINRAPLDQSSAIAIAGIGNFVAITNPVAVGARGNLIYIVDAAKQLVYRYNSGTENLTPLYSVSSHIQGIPSAIMVDHDGSFYLADGFGRQVLHFSMHGDLLRTFQNDLNLSNPVAVTLSTAGKVLIADRLFDHVLVFDRLGQAQRAFGERGTGKGQLLELIDMATGPDGIYVLDRLSKSVKIFDDEGMLVRQLARPEVSDPTAIAVDYAERVYISDSFDDSIKIYDRNGLIESVGTSGSQNGQFRMITDLHVDNNFLYVADSANDRVQVFLIKSATHEEIN